MSDAEYTSLFSDTAIKESPKSEDSVLSSDSRQLQARMLERSRYNEFQTLSETDLHSVVHTRLTLKEYLPESFDKLNLGIIKILTASINLLDVDFVFEDYSYIIFPALKATEAVIYQILNLLHISLPNRFRIGWLFKDAASGTPEELSRFVLSEHSEYYNSIPERYHVYLETLYNIVNRYRHYYFHADKDEEALSFIPDKAYAEELLAMIFVEIDNTAAILGEEL